MVVVRKNKNHDQKEIPCCVVLLATCYLKGLLGLDIGTNMDFDFDMLISKEGGSTVETPWHQDESYWLDLPDKVNRILI